MSAANCLYRSSDLGKVAAALAAGGRLHEVVDTPGALVSFTLENVPPDFERLLMNDQVQVGARSLLDHLERLHRIVRPRKQARGASR